MSRQLKLQMGQVYCIDTDSLIELKKYPRDVFPSVWQKLEAMIRGKELISHDQAYREITIGQDEIVSWCKRHKKIFKDADDCQSGEIKNVQTKYDAAVWEKEINRTTPWADPWLIALARCEGGQVVTEESNKPNRIPFVSNLVNVQCLKLIDFFRKIGIKL